MNDTKHSFMNYTLIKKKKKKKNKRQIDGMIHKFINILDTSNRKVTLTMAYKMERHIKIDEVR